MGTYLQPVDVPRVEIVADDESKTVTITGKMGKWTFRAGRVITISENLPCFLINEVHPNGITVTDSETSIVKFWSWRRMFNGDTIWRDIVDNTGLMKIT